MKKDLFVYRTRIQAPAEEVFHWHTRPGALERLNPPWEKIEVLERTGGIKDGSKVLLLTRIGLISQRWVVEHRDYREGRQFRDRQVAGPFAFWEHTHRLLPDGPSACYLEDAIEYSLPFGALGKLLGSRLVRSKLERLFSYRHQVIKEDIETIKSYGGSQMKVLVTGSTGLIGSALVPFLTTSGNSVTRLTRSKTFSGSKFGESVAYWNPNSRKIDSTVFEGHDAVVHLAGENVAGIWTEEKKNRIRKSRVEGTRLLSRSLADLKAPPKVLVCASAIGYYGNREDETLTEESGSGRGFLAEVCLEWEKSCQPALEKGIRVVNLRIGLVLSPQGGALKTMLIPFRLGVGGTIGSGDQYVSWIAIDDMVGAIYHAISKENLNGPVNSVAPNPVTNREFTKTLARVLGRPSFLSVPEFALRLLTGEMAEEMLLASTRAVPKKLLDTGYKFRYPQFEGALRHLLGKAEK